MALAVAFALASLVFAGLLDVVYRGYARVPRSRGMYVMGIGLVWSIAQALIVTASGDWDRIDAATLAFGIGAGVVVSVANLCLIESLTHIDVGLASTIYRLNTIGVVALAAILLAEPLTATKLAGVLLGVCAAILLYQPNPRAPHARLFAAYFWLAVLASVLRAGFGIISKAADLHGVDLRLLLFVNAPAWIAAGAAYAMLREDGIRFTAAKLRYSVISGLLVCAVVNFLMLALERGEASVVVPIANMSFLVALLLSLGLRMERLTGRKTAAVAAAVAAIFILARA